jgi:hypothetical protein
MSTRLRLFVLAASTALFLLALPDCCLVLAEELARPLSESGTPLLARSTETSLPARELLAMRAPASGSLDRHSIEDASITTETESTPGARAER